MYFLKFQRELPVLQSTLGLANQTKKRPVDSGVVVFNEGSNFKSI